MENHKWIWKRWQKVCLCMIAAGAILLGAGAILGGEVAGVIFDQNGFSVSTDYDGIFISIDSEMISPPSAPESPKAPEAPNTPKAPEIH
jgi:hypothetical protein